MLHLMPSFNNCYQTILHFVKNEEFGVVLCYFDFRDKERQHREELEKLQNELESKHTEYKNTTEAQISKHKGILRMI